MGRLVDIIKVTEDDCCVAYKYIALNERVGLVIVDKHNRDFFHAIASEQHATYFAVKHKLKKCLEMQDFPDSLSFASG